MSSSEPDYTQLNQPEGKWFGLVFFVRGPEPVAGRQEQKAWARFF